MDQLLQLLAKSQKVRVENMANATEKSMWEEVGINVENKRKINKRNLAKPAIKPSVIS